MITEEAIIKRLSTEPFCLFVGSGVSREVGLPSGSELGQMILEALGVSSAQALDLAKAYHLERMLFFLKDVLGESVPQVYSALSSPFFGLNHIALASLNKANVPILTTNQDELIEKAAGGDLCKGDLIKIHGTLSNIMSLRVTLDAVSELPLHVSERLSTVTKSRIVVAIGYSFSDYDLRDFFISCGDRLFCCTRTGVLVNKFLRDMVYKGDKQAYDDHSFISSAEQFLPNLSKALNVMVRLSNYSRTVSVKNSFKKAVHDWATQYPDYMRELAIGRLPLGMWRAKRSFEMLAKVVERKLPPFFHAVALAEAADSAHAHDECAREKTLLRKVKKIRGLDRNIRKLLYSLYSAAHYHVQDNPFEWRMALHLFKKSRCLLLAILQTDKHEAENRFLKSFEKKIDHGIASSLEKLNRYPFLGDTVEDALQFIEPYVEKRKPCDLDFMCEALFIRGKLYLHMKDVDNAEKAYRKAFEIADWIKDKHSIDQAYRGLGRIMALKGDFEQARSLLENSYKTAMETDQECLLARNHLTWAWFYALTGDLKKARDHLVEGRTIYRQHRGIVKGTIDSYFYFRDRKTIK